jgi:hypothetical protein
MLKGSAQSRRKECDKVWLRSVLIMKGSFRWASTTWKKGCLGDLLGGRGALGSMGTRRKRLNNSFGQTIIVHAARGIRGDRTAAEQPPPCSIDQSPFGGKVVSNCAH